MFDDFFDSIYTGIANVLYFISGISIGVSIISFILTVIYVLIYSYTELFSHSHYKYIQNMKKLAGFILGTLAIAIILFLIAHTIMANVYT